MKQHGKFGKYEYIPIVLTFFFLLGCFGVALATMPPRAWDKLTRDVMISPTDRITANLSSDDGAGARYYIVSSSSNGASSQSQIDIPHTLFSSDSENTRSSQTDNGKERQIAEIEVNDVESQAPVSSQPTSNRKIAYLTFDDGPSENTKKILDILDEYDVKATFFVIYHKNMESRYREIVKRGHTIALHSYTHNYKKIYTSEDAYFADLTKISEYVESATGVKSHIIRFPGGSSNTISNKYCQDIMKQLKKDVVDRGYIYHDWNVDSTDASGNNRAPEVLLENVQKSLTKHRIANILMHDTGSTKQTTVEALPSIIEYVQSQGYEIEKITEDSKAIRHT